MKFLILCCLFLSNPAFSETSESYFFQKGLLSTEKLNHFLASHPCELGMDKTCERPFTAKKLLELKTYFLELEEWRRIAFDGISPMGELKIDSMVDVKMGSTFKIERTNKTTIYLGPDPRSERFVGETIISSANMVFLYESFFRLADSMMKAKKLRAILERDLPFEAPVLATTYSLVFNESLWNKTKYSVIFLEKIKTLGLKYPTIQDEEIFKSFLQKSFLYEKFKKDDLDFRIKKILFLAGEIGGGKFFDHIYSIVGLLSKIFGNTAGMFQSRDGKLKALTTQVEQMKNLKRTLKPLSILLEKTPFRLTDHFIPGYFGHVAIWLGTPEELSSMKVTLHNKVIPFTDHPLVKPHLEKIKNGRLVLEALRLPGVTLNTLENFLDIDDLVILDPPSMDESERMKHLLRAFAQIGKPYDFNFNVESEVEIVCSELIYAVFTEENWPVSRTMERYTISPDHVAWKALESFSPVSLFLEGKKIEKDLKEKLQKVLNLPGGIKP